MIEKPYLSLHQSLSIAKLAAPLPSGSAFCSHSRPAPRHRAVHHPSRIYTGSSVLPASCPAHFIACTCKAVRDGTANSGVIAFAREEERFSNRDDLRHGQLCRCGRSK
jgi:hypothetical protein